MKKNIFILFLLIASVFSQCPGFHTDDFLQSGKNSIVKTRSINNREYEYEALISFPMSSKSIQIAVTTSTIAGFNPLPSIGSTYILSANRKRNQNSILYKLLINNDQSWTSIQVSYLVSGREDMAIGNIQIPYSRWGKPSSNVYNIVYQVPKYLHKTNYKVAAFISGISTADPLFNIIINKKFFNYETKQLIIGVYCSANPAVLTMTLSYIIYPETHPIFDLSYHMQPQGQVGSYQVTGPVSFSNKKIQYNEWVVGNRFLACTGNQCLNSCELRQQCAQKNGNIWEGSCIYCPVGVVFQYGRCSRKCGVNQIYINKVCLCQKGFTRRGKDCLKDNACGTNQYFHDVKGCVCKDRCAKLNGQCIQCPYGAVSTNDGLSCVCTDPNQIYSLVAHRCENRCLQNQIWSNNRCNCISKHCWWNQVCRQCPQDADVSADQYTCLCRGSNTFYNPEQNRCVQCSGSTRINDERTGCICRNGYTYQGGSCIIKCSQGQIYNTRTGNCQCKPGLQKYNGYCQQVRNCPTNQQWKGKQCVCISQFARYNGKCRRCPTGTLPNSLKTTCICTHANKIFVPDKFLCAVCPKNSIPSQNLTKCVCKKGYSVLNKECILRCSPFQVPNHELGRCQCQFGYFKQAEGYPCKPRCTDNQQWNGNKCVCAAGRVLVEGSCRLCPSNSLGNSERNGCICKIPNEIFDLSRFQCVSCPLYSSPSSDRLNCLCNKGYKTRGTKCSPICNFDQYLNPQTGFCQCKYGFMKVGPSCVDRCGFNQEWNGKQCLCKIGYVKFNGVCQACPPGSSTNSIRTNCICQNNKHYFNSPKFICQACPTNSYPNSEFSDFICYAGYKRDGYSCINMCSQGAYPNQAGQCICGGGLVYLDNSCRKPIVCPFGSSWDQKSLQCVCSSKGFFLIDGECQTCGDNSVYNKNMKRCVCSTGFFAIAGECRICDARSSYNGTDCVCNLGYFGNREKCQKCHPSCSRCKGPQANQCLTCSDVSLILEKGYCSANTPCNPGFYLHEAICTKCSDNCIMCNDIFKCNTCAIGYQNQKSKVGDEEFELCEQICGDGFRFMAQCDDGNNNDKDGCSSKCTVEPGWTCQNGSSSRKSICNKFIPDQTILSAKGAVNLGDRVIQSVRASYLPNCLTKNQCNNCFKALKVNVIDAYVPVLVKINYVPFSQYQFLIQYNFQGLIVTSRFKAVIKLNDDFKGCLADDDYNQQIQLEVDPAFLAKIDSTESLQFQDITDNTDDENKTKISIPKNAQDILGINN